MKSIMQSRKECFFTKRTTGLHEHHVFGAGNRKNSEKYGLKVWLTPELHNMGGNGADVHHHAGLDLLLKALAQKIAMEHYGWTKEDFIRIFHKNYL